MGFSGYGEKRLSNNGYKALILMGHGSRVPGAGKSMEDVADRLREISYRDIVETCYMSRLGPHFGETLELCVKKGASEVVLIPYFLNLGLHMKVDIPKMLKKEAEKYPALKLVFGKNLGFDELLVELVKKRLEESSAFCDVRELGVEPDDYKLPPGDKEFVAMTPKEAREYKAKYGGCGHSHEH